MQETIDFAWLHITQNLIWDCNFIHVIGLHGSVEFEFNSNFRALLCFFFDLFFSCFLFFGRVSFCCLGCFSFLSWRLGRSDFRKFEKIIHTSLIKKVLKNRKSKTDLVCLSLCFLHPLDSISHTFLIEAFFTCEKFYTLFDLKTSS